MSKRRLIGGLGFLIGLCVICYPAGSNLWNEWRQSVLAREYEEIVASSDTSSLWQEAWDYNSNLSGNLIMDAFSYEEGKADSAYDSLLNPSGNGIMGYISIPKIDVYLPIYHGTGDEALSSGIGHLYGTSLPVGGEGTHTVLAGHRGLPSAALFTDLDWLEEGDVFYLYILDDVLAYEVYEIKTVEPSDTSSLAIVPGADLVTLVTCTPYGVNTHRLLVHGRRTEYTETVEEGSSGTTLHSFAWMAYGLPAIGLGFVLLLAFVLHIRGKGKK